MIELYVNRGNLQALNLQLSRLSQKSISPIIRRAAKRAVTHAKSIGTKHVKSIYTIDSYSIKRAIGGIRTTEDGAFLRIAGPRVSAGHYKVKALKTNNWWRKDTFISIKKGSGDVVPRAFEFSNTVWRREEGGEFGYWGAVEGRVFGPAVPQLFGNPAIKEEIEARTMRKYEERIRHEVGRLIGG